jgi:hypothetical protein
MRALEDDDATLDSGFDMPELDHYDCEPPSIVGISKSCLKSPRGPSKLGLVATKMSSSQRNLSVTIQTRDGALIRWSDEDMTLQGSAEVDFERTRTTKFSLPEDWHNSCDTLDRFVEANSKDEDEMFPYKPKSSSKSVGEKRVKLKSAHDEASVRSSSRRPSRRSDQAPKRRRSLSTGQSKSSSSKNGPSSQRSLSTGPPTGSKSSSSKKSSKTSSKSTSSKNSSKTSSSPKSPSKTKRPSSSKNLTGSDSGKIKNRSNRKIEQKSLTCSDSVKSMSRSSNAKAQPIKEERPSTRVPRDRDFRLANTTCLASHLATPTRRVRGGKSLTLHREGTAIIDELQLKSFALSPESMGALSPDIISVVSTTQRRLKLRKAQSARSVSTPSSCGDFAEWPQLIENGDEAHQQDARLVAESQESSSSRRRISCGALSPENVPMVSTQRRLKLRKAQSARSVVTPEGSDDGQRDAQSVAESQGVSISQRESRGALSAENIPVVSTQRRLKLRKAQSARSVVTPEESDEAQRDAPCSFTESQGSSNSTSRRGNRSLLLSQSKRQGSSSRLLSSPQRSSRLLSSQGRSSRLISAQPQRQGSCSLSPSINRHSDGSRLLTPSMRQGGSSRVLSSSMRNLVASPPESANDNSHYSYTRQGSSSRLLSSSMRNLLVPLPESGNDNSRRSSRPQSLRSILSLGIPEPPIASPLSSAPRDGSFRGDLPKLPMTPKEKKEQSTPVSRRKSRQGKRTDLIANMLGFDVQSSPKLNVYDLSPMPLCKADEESEDEESVCDSMSNFVQARLLDPGTKKKRLQLSLHGMGESLKNNLSKPVKNYVKTRKKKKTTNEWSLYQG